MTEEELFEGYGLKGNEGQEWAVALQVFAEAWR